MSTPYFAKDAHAEIESLIPFLGWEIFCYCKNEELCILHFDIRLPVSVKNHSLQHHNDGKKVYLDKIPLYDYNYVHNHIDTKLQIQVTKIRPAIKCQYKIKS